MDKSHLEYIIEILKKSGRMHRTDLKLDVMKKMQLDTYAKQTYSYHLTKLVKEKKIIKEGPNIKQEYYYVPKYDHPIPGGLILEKLDARINSPSVLLDSGIHINNNIPLSLDKKLITLIFQFNSQTFCLNIPKDLVLFKIHISRKWHVPEIYQEVNYNFQNRTITLELPILKLSRYKLDTELKENKTGHLLLSFEDNDVSITDLDATNPSEIAIIKELTIDNFLNEVSLLSDFTFDVKNGKNSSKIIEKNKLTNKQTKKLQLPNLILLSEEAQLAIF